MISDIQICTRFFDILDWICRVMVRYPQDFSFALVRIAYGNNNALGEAYGAPDAVSQLSSLTVDLQHAFRSSDLVGRKGTDFWVIFPYTRFGENLHEKLLEVLQDADHDSLNIVQREISVFELPYILHDQPFQPDNGDSLLHFLNQHPTLASHRFKLAQPARA